MIRKIVRKLFVTGNYFTIAVKKRDGDVLDYLRFSAEYTVPASREEWCADPFLAEEEGHVYLFYEKVHGDLGSIEVSEVRQDCTLGNPVLLFSDSSHYSYPYVFQKNGRWYMIPESSAMNEVSLYAAEQFPYRWKKEAVLLKKSAVDTTVFEMNHQWYLLTFVPVHGTERVTPFAFRMNGIQLEPMEWKDFNPLCVRGAGRPFLYQDSWIRPVQVSTDIRYGDKVAFSKIEVDGNVYRETVLYELTPKKVNAKGQFYDGLHTYSCSNHFEVIDIRCGKLSLIKPIQKITNRLIKR